VNLENGFVPIDISVPKTTLPYTICLEFLFTNTFLVGRVCKGNQKVRRDLIGKICKYCGKLLNTARVLRYHFKIEGKIILAIVEKTSNLNPFLQARYVEEKIVDGTGKKLKNEKKLCGNNFANIVEKN
jgi:hypothetical protein